MEFLILNRQIAEDICTKATRPHIIISIYSTDSTPANIIPTNTCKGLLQIAFDDVEEDEWMYGDTIYKVITEQQATSIWDFINSSKDYTLIIIHCDGGVCRSPAVGAAIAKVLNEDNKSFFNNPYWLPNKKVYETMLKTYD